MKAILLSFIFILVVFVIIFPRNLEPELTVIPEWEIELTPGSFNTTGDDLMAVRVGDVFGYVDGDGQVQYSDVAHYGVALSESSFINYSSVNQNLVLRDNSGRVVESLSARGYPYFIGDRRYILVTDRTGIEELDADGFPLWSRTFSSVIVDVAAAEDRTLVGLLDGRIMLISGDGEKKFEQTISGSSFDGVFGCAISSDGTQIGAVAGLSPQKLVLFEQRGDSFDMVSSKNLTTETRGYVHTEFTADGTLLIASQKDHLFAIHAGNEVLLPINGQLRALSSHTDGSLNIISNDEDHTWIYRYASPGTLLYSVRAPDGDVFIRAVDEELWIGIGSQIAKYALEAR